MSVLGFFFMWFFSFCILALALGLLGLDFSTAFSSAAAAIANVGPGLGPIVGPAGNFASLPDTAKWLLSGGMLLGRLELFHHCPVHPKLLARLNGMHRSLYDPGTAWKFAIIGICIVRLIRFKLIEYRYRVYMCRVVAKCNPRIRFSMVG